MGHIYISKDNILHSQKSPRTTPTESFLEVASVVFLVLWFIRTLKIIFTKNPFHFVFRGMGFFYLCLASPKTISVQVSHTLPPLTINKTNCVFCLLLVEPFPVWFGLEFSLGGGGKDFLRLFFFPSSWPWTLFVAQHDLPHSPTAGISGRHKPPHPASKHN